MTELEQRTTTVPATSFDKVFNPAVKDIDVLFGEIIKFYELTPEQVNKLKLGSGTEKLSKSTTLKIMLSIIITILDDHKTVNTSNKTDEAIYLANKKITKDLAFSLFTLLNNYEYNDKDMKIQLMGKTLQSLYGKY